MSDARDPQTLVTAAEQAAAMGDHAFAERLLREAASLQEASLGPLHPDLANTLNNLGVVCEITDNPVDAEHYFRRACAIATAVLASDHPFVSTSRKNLEDFCAARGKAVKLPWAVSIATGAAAITLVPEAHDPVEEARTTAEPSKPVIRDRGRTAFVIAAVITAGLLLTLAAARFRSSDQTGLQTIPAMSPDRPAAQEESASVQPIPSKASREAVNPASGAPPAERRQPATSSTTGRTAGAEGRSAPSTVPQPPVMVAAELCRTLSISGPGEWRCVRPNRPMDPGALFFYTRVKSPVPVTLQHRWYRGERVRQVVELPTRANMRDGYRTYSRQTVDARNPGEWRVELRTSDGVVLREERFVTR